MDNHQGGARMNDTGMQDGTFVWNELASRDLPAARAFFTGLLGWTYTETDMQEMGRYTMIRQGGREIGGMMSMDGDAWGDLPSHWMSYVAVPDVDAKAGMVEALGGRVCVPPTDIPGVGRFTVIQDPSGATVSLITFTAAPPQG